MKPTTSTLFKFRGTVSGVSNLANNGPPTINIISTLAQKIGPIDEIKETESKVETSVRKLPKQKKSGDNSILPSNNSNNAMFGNHLSPYDYDGWNFVPSQRKVSLRESPSRRVNRHL